MLATNLILMSLYCAPCLLKQQSRRRFLTPDGFALSPIRAVFSDSIVRVVERAVK